MGKPQNPLSDAAVSGDLDGILLSDAPTVNGEKVVGFDPEEIDQSTRTLDEKDQGKEFASFTMYKRVSDLSAEQRQIIKDVVSMELKPALEEALSHLGYRDAEDSADEDGVIDASEDYSVPNVAVVGNEMRVVAPVRRGADIVGWVGVGRWRIARREGRRRPS